MTGKWNSNFHERINKPYQEVYAGKQETIRSSLRDSLSGKGQPNDVTNDLPLEALQTIEDCKKFVRAKYKNDLLYHGIYLMKSHPS